MNYTETFDERGKLYNQAHQIAPKARLEERQALLKWLCPRPDETILVAAAGGGFDAVGIANAVRPGKARIICVEPSEIFSTEIPREFEIINSPLENIPLESNSVDAVVNLAAMHHVENRLAVLKEWLRILKPGGRIVIGDVQVKTANASFLNTAVNQYTPGGHDGRFLVPGEMSELLRDLSAWEKLEEHYEEYEWGFADEPEMISFTQHLFGMVKATQEDVRSSIQKHLGILTPGGRASVSFSWSLRFIYGIQPMQTGG